MRTGVSVLVSALLVSAADYAEAQSVLTGTVVVDATPSPPLSDAEVAIPALGLLARTDSLGQFLFTRIPRGTYRITVRRVGYEGIAVSGKFSGTDTVAADFALTALTVTLDTVSVKGKAAVPGKFQEFEERRVAGFGAFLRREDFDKERDRPLAEVLSRLSGVRVTRYGSQASIASQRWMGGRSRGGDSFDRMKGAPPGCYAQIYLDGVRIFSSSAGEPLFDINSLETSSIQGIEYYAGGAQTPIQFNPRNADCGTVVIWTRIN